MTCSTSSGISSRRTQQALTCVEGQPLAITICEDAWNDKGFWPRQMYPVDPVEELMEQWAALPKQLAGRQRIILNISASPYWQGKPQVRREMLAAMAERHGAYVVMVNQVGGNDSLVFDGVVAGDSAGWRGDGAGGFVCRGSGGLRYGRHASGGCSGRMRWIGDRRSMWDALVLGRGIMCGSAGSARRWWD